MDEALNYQGGQALYPYGHCFGWRSWILGTNAASELLMAAAYCTVPLALFYLTRRRPDLHLRRIVPPFTVFFFASAITHLIEVYNTWNPAFEAEAWIDSTTSIITLFAAVQVWRHMPSFLKVKNPRDLERTVDERTLALVEAKLEVTNYRDELRALTARLEEVREEERTRISRELHDQLGQDLTVLKIGLSTAADTLAESGMTDDVEGVYRQLKLNIANVDATIKSVRRIATQLRPPILDGLGLAAALDWHVQEFSRKTGIECKFECSDSKEFEDSAVGTALFRAAQELLTNVARHAGASKVRVFFDRSEEGVILEIADNGSGIRGVMTPKPESVGLIGVRERVESVGGTLSLENGPSGGTIARIEIQQGKNTVETVL